MQSIYRSHRILLPVRPGFIILTLVLALILNALPVGHLYLMPDFVALVLTMWCMREPLRVGIGTAFLLGVIVDVTQGAALGQHALAYVLLAYASGLMSRRLTWFSPPVQALHVGPLFLGAQVLMLVVRLIAGGRFPGWSYFWASLTTTLLWIPLYYLLLIPQMRPIDRDENRPL